jgi:hypothetical protein
MIPKIQGGGGIPLEFFSGARSRGMGRRDEKNDEKNEVRKTWGWKMFHDVST